MNKINRNLDPMNEAEYTKAVIEDELRNMGREYKYGVSGTRIKMLVKWISLIKERGIKATIEEESN